MTFIVTTVVLLAYALNGGTYDVVPRDQAAVLLWVALGLLAALGLAPRRRLSFPAWTTLAGFGLLAAWTLVGFRHTESDERTSIELARILHHCALFALTVCLLRRRSAGVAIAGATAAATIVSALAVASRLHPSWFPANTLGALSGNRLSYPLDYWNGVGAWSAIAAAMALAWSAHAQSTAWRAAALATVPVSVAAVYLTYSRAGAAGVALGFIVVVAAGRTRAIVVLQGLVAAAGSALVVATLRHEHGLAIGKGTAGSQTVVLALLAAAGVCVAAVVGLGATGADTRLRMSSGAARRAAAAAAVLAVIGGALVLPPVVNRALNQFDGPAYIAPDSADPATRLSNLSGNRSRVWQSALDAFKAHPSEGTGPGTFEFWWSRDAVNVESVRDAHSFYLEALAETGWPGLLATLVLCGGLLLTVIRARVAVTRDRDAAPTVAALAAVVLWLFHAGVDWMWEETAVTALMLVVAGAAAATLGGDVAKVRWPVRVAVAAVATASVLAQLPPLIGTSDVRESQAAIAAGDPQRAQRAAQAAVSAWPWAATPYVQRALVDEQRGNLGGALADAQRAERREPTNWRHPLLVARLELQLGHAHPALAAFARSRKLRPLASVLNRVPQP